MRDILNFKKSFLFISVCLTLFFWAGCKSEKVILNDVDPYNKFIGKKFELLSDSIVIKISGDKYLLCLNDHRSRSILGLSANISYRNIGETVNGIQIIDYLRKKSFFVVRNAIKKTTLENSTYSFEIYLNTNGYIVDSFWITHYGKMDFFVPKFNGKCIKSLDNSSDEFLWWPKNK